MTPAVQFDMATHRFRSGVTVGPLSIRVSPGEVVALVGHNGSGKTTALRMALGLAPVHDGAIFVNGDAVSTGLLPAGCVGMIETPAFLNGLSGAQNLELCTNGDHDRGERIGETLDLVGLGQSHKRVADYSLGMKQRLAIARALLPDASLLMLDEPANGLDADGSRWFHGLIRNLANDGRAILLASHLLAQLSSVVDYTVSMDAGRQTDVTKGTARRSSTDHAEGPPSTA